MICIQSVRDSGCRPFTNRDPGRDALRYRARPADRLRHADIGHMYRRSLVQRRAQEMNEVWTKWEGLVVNGVLPLRRCLSASDHSAVFLTAYAAFDIPDAAIKLVPAAPGSADAQLAHWRTAIALTHPHLMRLFDAGRCELGG